MNLISQDDKMRLIDGVTLKAEFTGNFNGGYYTVPEIRALIDTAPTVDAVPVIHGRWEPHQTRTGKNWWQCNICGEVSEHKRNHFFCHFCGAKMDGGEADDHG